MPRAAGRAATLKEMQLPLTNTVLGEALKAKQAVWVSDCTAFMQNSRNPHQDVYLATSQEAAGCMVVCPMYHQDRPFMALYLNMSQRYSTQVLETVGQALLETCAVMEPAIWHLLHGELDFEWRYLQTQVLGGPGSSSELQAGERILLSAFSSAARSRASPCLLRPPSTAQETPRLGWPGLGQSSARRIGALISGLQGKVQEAQRHQLQARAETLHQDELGNISISAKIGAGGFGACYRGLYQGTEAAIKVVHDRHGSATEVFRNAVELAVLSTLSHPNIVQVLTYFTDVGVSYPSADDLMTTPEAAPRWPAIYQTLLELALALRYLHSLSLVHRDVKLQNVLLKSHSNDPRGFTCKLSGEALHLWS
ncbi:predicted protein, partial [Haematococcus lacustris]